jgi:hypothetical protein
VDTAPESSPDSLVAHLATTSIYVTMEPAERAKRLAEVRKIATRYGKQFPMPQQTHTLAFRRL